METGTGMPHAVDMEVAGGFVWRGDEVVYLVSVSGPNYWTPVESY